MSYLISVRISSQCCVNLFFSTSVRIDKVRNRLKPQGVQLVQIELPPIRFHYSSNLHRAKLTSRFVDLHGYIFWRRIFKQNRKRSVRSCAKQALLVETRASSIDETFDIGCWLDVRAFPRNQDRLSSALRTRTNDSTIESPNANKLREICKSKETTSHFKNQMRDDGIFVRAWNTFSQTCAVDVQQRISRNVKFLRFV